MIEKYIYTNLKSGDFLPFFLFSSSFIIEHIHTLHSYKSKILENSSRMAINRKHLILIMNEGKIKIQRGTNPLFVTLQKAFTSFPFVHWIYSLKNFKLIHTFQLHILGSNDINNPWKIGGFFLLYKHWKIYIVSHKKMRKNYILVGLWERKLSKKYIRKLK